MKSENAVREKSYAFAISIINLYRYLTEKKSEFVLSKQVLRSGTSIGANVEEAIGGQTEKDFLTKLNISYKEARETHYWLRLLRDTGYLTNKESEGIMEECEELMKIIGTITKTMKVKLYS